MHRPPSQPVRSRRWRRADFAAALALAAFGPAGTARAEPPHEQSETTTTAHRLQWQWRPAGVIDYATTAALGAGILAIALGTEQAEDPAWSGPILFDRGARNTLMGKSPAARRRANTASHYVAVAPSVVVGAGSLLIPLLADDWNTEVAWQLTVVNLQSAALAEMLTLGGKRLARRERPEVSECREDPDRSDTCFVSETESMPSGHTSSAFVAAGLGCTHHVMLGLLGEPVLDASLCAVLLATAATAGGLRVMADRHYLTDVLAGATVGLAAGVVTPLLTHYRSRSDSGRQAATGGSEVRWTVAPLAGGDRTGIALYGWF